MNLKEEAMLQHVSDLELQGVLPRLADVEDIVNLLLVDCNVGRVGKRWALNYVKQQPEPKMCLNRPYNYQKALCEDPEQIHPRNHRRRHQPLEVSYRHPLGEHMSSLRGHLQ